MKKVILIAIILLAAVLRLWNLGNFPAFNADEAAIGYNAYSLIQTGKDEHGNSWPVHFQSFNDYKPGGYVYLVLPFVKFLGLNEWSVRLPNAFLGIATVFIFYLLINELKIGNLLKIKNFKLKIGEIGAFMLAISPWHLHFSRGGWEVNTATFFILLGVYLFLKFTNTAHRSLSTVHGFYLAFSLLSFAFSLYTYHATRIVVPLLALGLIVIYWQELQVKKFFKFYVLCTMYFVLLMLPLTMDLTKGAVSSRAAGVGLFADPGPLNRINEQRGEHENFSSIGAKLLHNKVVNYGLAFGNNWLKHYHGLFLFLSGDDIQRNKVPETGQLYLFEIITVLLGVFVLLKSSFLNPKSSRLVFLWLLVAPMASALTFQSPHALRSQNMVIPLTIISGLGLSYLASWFSYKKLKNGNWLLVIIIAWSLMRYMHMYWVHMAKEYPYSSQYGVYELVDYVSKNSDNYQKVLVTDKYDQPYILFLFYLKYDPAKFQLEHSLTGKDSYGFSTVNHFDKYYFTRIIYDQAIPDNPNSLIVGTPEEITKEANIIKDIYGTNGYKYFRIVAN